MVSTGHLVQCNGQHRSLGTAWWSAQVTWYNVVVSTGHLEQRGGQHRSLGTAWWSAQVTWYSVVVSTGHLEQRGGQHRRGVGSRDIGGGWP